MKSKKENIFQYIGRLFKENILDPFRTDKRVRMSWSEKQNFIRQVRTLERNAVNTVSK